MPKATAILAALSWTWAAGGGSGGGREETAATVTAEAVAVGMVVAVAGRSQAGGGGAPKNKPFGSNPFAQGDPFAQGGDPFAQGDGSACFCWFCMRKKSKYPICICFLCVSVPM